ncbi:cyclophilin-like fold protein [Actinomyces faecalis]|uniref:cyclophilin-like fold protein n=1 Tax=Actinomyces faecalis TaxID=2722820 RepID=UPI0015557A6D|nr:cyclophilin-like fold protein [Actinomyces faecalis]
MTDSQDSAEAAGASVTLVIDGRAVEAVVWDNPTGRDLLEQLPLTLQFSDYAGQEKLADLPRELTMEGMPRGDSPQVGDLGYYSPNGVLVIYTSKVGYWNGIARIGRVTGDLSVVTGQSGDFEVRIERAS